MDMKEHKFDVWIENTRLPSVRPLHIAVDLLYFCLRRVVANFVGSSAQNCVGFSAP